MNRKLYLPTETIRRLLAQPDTSSAKGIRDKAALLLMALHNLRVSEIAALNVSDLDIRAGTLRVSNGHERTIALVGPALIVLRRWREVRRLMEPDSPALFITLHHTDAITAPGGRISIRALRKAVDGYLVKIGAKSSGTSCDLVRLSVREAARTNPASIGTLLVE